MKRKLLSLLFAIMIMFTVVGCEKKSSLTQIHNTGSQTQTGGSSNSTTNSSITTKSGIQVTSIPEDAVFEGFEWSSDYTKCNAVFTANNETLKLNVEINAEITDTPTCAKTGTLVVNVTYGEHTETKTVSIPKLAHQPGEAKKENVVTKENGDVEYDLVTYCTVCGEELSRVHKVDKAGSENIDTPWIEG